jgi:hypothetical protein
VHVADHSIDPVKVLVEEWERKERDVRFGGHVGESAVEKIMVAPKVRVSQKVHGF